MRQDKYPPGWDEDRAQRVIAPYEQQSEEQAVAEDTAYMEVPKELVPTVREMIADYEKAKKAKSA